MHTEQWKTLVNFLRDSAKIVFGSLVIGTLVSFPEKQISWILVLLGSVSTVFLLLVAIGLARYNEKI